MSSVTNEELEGRLTAQREVLALLIANLARLQDRHPEITENVLEELDQELFQDHQEDPGAVPSGEGLAIQGSITREFRQIIEEARGYLTARDKD